ncbi:hypothetical protein BJ138DRAFT_1116378 [Hygrophoropsis aurantiaca]|uniref:Uncharacterized protein n=1 Tax=Hygrophoropsis aurantiaca TaxID=72124 RepID=A0ACB8A471_9AGAM|nr:hypothetical protein BJ138DRAFT_1116378 [Hygrophoropsis aurantiaca]
MSSVSTGSRMIKEEWAPPSVTSVFHISESHEKYYLARGTKVNFGDCGLGWQFSLSGRRSDGRRFAKTKGYQTLIYDLYFHQRSEDLKIGHTKVNVVASLSPVDAVTLSRSVTLDPGPNPSVEIGRWTEQEILSATKISFVVTIIDPSQDQNFVSLLHQPVTPQATDPSLLTLGPINPSDLHAAVTQPAVLKILAQSLGNGSFFDTKFIIPSRRKTNGNIGAPRTVYARVAVLEAISPLLSIGNILGKDNTLFVDLAGVPGVQSSNEEYDYESDSDWDGDEDRERGPTTEGRSELAGVTIEEIQDKTHRFKEDTSLTTPALPSLLEASNNDDVQPPSSNDIISVSSFSDFEKEGTKHAPIPTDHGTSAVHNIYVKGVSYKTWRAFVYYCYTGRVEFSPLRSCMITPANIPEGEDRRCSPKSMYRLAKMIRALEDVAATAIHENLSKSNILDEAFSKFTSLYPVIQQMEMEILMKNRTSPAIIQVLPDIIRRMFEGEIPHAQKMVSDVMQSLFEGESTVTRRGDPSIPVPYGEVTGNADVSLEYKLETPRDSDKRGNSPSVACHSESENLWGFNQVSGIGFHPLREFRNSVNVDRDNRRAFSAVVSSAQ